MKLSPNLLIGIIYMMLFIVVVFYLIRPSASDQTYDAYTQIKLPKIAVLYAYFEKDEDYKKNLEFFLKHGLVDHAVYYFVVNGKCSVTFPTKKNITVFYRENEGFDFGAWSYAVEKLSALYDYYFFINTSVRGPYYPAGDKRRNWIDIFLDLFSENVKLVGTTINTQVPGPHVQSMFFGIDAELFLYLQDIHFFDSKEKYRNVRDLIEKKEIGLSTIVLRKGWNINSIIPEFRNRDYRLHKVDFNPTSFNGCPYKPFACFGRTLRKEEVIFIKTNRDLKTRELIDYKPAKNIWQRLLNFFQMHQ